MEDRDAPRIRGAVVLHQIKLMKNDYGERLVARALERLDATQRRILDDAMAMSWIDMGVFGALKYAVAVELEMDPLDLQRAIVRRAMNTTIDKLWRVMLRQISDRALVKRTPLLYSRGLERGELTVQSIRTGYATLRLTGWSDISEFDLVGVAGGIEAVLEYAGRRDPAVTWDRLGLAIALEARWR